MDPPNAVNSRHDHKLELTNINRDCFLKYKSVQKENDTSSKGKKKHGSVQFSKVLSQ